DLIGELEWGVTGASHKVQFDWGRGGQLNISAIAFHLKVGYPSAKGPRVRVHASVSPGTRGATETNRVTLTKYHAVTGPNYVERVPNFAHSVAVFTSNQALYDTDQLAIEMLGVDQSVRYRVFARNPAAIDLPNNIFFVRLLNTSAAVIQTSLLFGLAL
ncbi:MAG TPA: hypothetical protein PK156_51625, partial [Polyangium sp.]|nr:hypothetical protein [Polyangium sp.]